MTSELLISVIHISNKPCHFVTVQFSQLTGKQTDEHFPA